MSLYSELLFDMNALSYLDKLVILPQALGCVERPLTSDLIRYKEMSHEHSRPRWEEAERCGMMSLELSEEEMAEVVQCMLENKGLSLYDAGMIFLCRKTGFPLFTEDKKMISVMERLCLPRVSLVSFVEALGNAGVLSGHELVEICERICAELLPKRYDAECEQICQRFLIAEED